MNSTANEVSDIQDRNIQLILKHIEAAEDIACGLRQKFWWVPLEDLKTGAKIGLAKAAQGFCPLIGNDFSRYAFKFIRGEILHMPEVRRIPPKVWQTVVRYREAHDALCMEKKGKMPTISEIAQKSGLSVFETMRAKDIDDLIFEKELTEDGFEAHLRTTDESPAYGIMDIRSEAFQIAEKSIPSKKMEVFKMRYQQDLSCGEIAERTGLSEGQVRIWNFRTGTKLRKLMTNIMEAAQANALLIFMIAFALVGVFCNSPSVTSPIARKEVAGENATSSASAKAVPVALTSESDGRAVRDGVLVTPASQIQAIPAIVPSGLLLADAANGERYSDPYENSTLVIKAIRRQPNEGSATCTAVSSDTFEPIIIANDTNSLVATGAAVQGSNLIQSNPQPSLGVIWDFDRISQVATIVDGSLVICYGGLTTDSLAFGDGVMPGGNGHALVFADTIEKGADYPNFITTPEISVSGGALMTFGSFAHAGDMSFLVSGVPAANTSYALGDILFPSESSAIHAPVLGLAASGIKSGAGLWYDLGTSIITGNTSPTLGIAFSTFAQESARARIIRTAANGALCFNGYSDSLLTDGNSGAIAFVDDSALAAPTTHEDISIRMGAYPASSAYLGGPTIPSSTDAHEFVVPTPSRNSDQSPCENKSNLLYCSTTFIIRPRRKKIGSREPNEHLSEETLLNYHDGLCGVLERFHIEQHLKGCLRCTSRLEYLREFEGIVREALESHEERRA